MTEERTIALLERIASSLERLAPAPAQPVDLLRYSAYSWSGSSKELHPVEHVAHVRLEWLHAIDHIRDILHANTLHFANGLPANNALLWGARGMGKSSLVKAIHADINTKMPGILVLVEIQREEIATLPALLAQLKAQPQRRFVLFCDDLAFEQGDAGYKSLKSVLDGGIEGRPENVLLYATSNRRHLMPRDMIENEQQTAIHPSEATEEKVSLSDRFGLWLGFYNCSQAQYLSMIDTYAKAYGLKVPQGDLHAKAIEWAATRGARSGRVAWQFITDMRAQMPQ